jgi:hypothetical protein
MAYYVGYPPSGQAIESTIWFIDGKTAKRADGGDQLIAVPRSNMQARRMMGCCARRSLRS